MKPSDYQVIDLKHAFEPIAMLTISKTLREMTRGQTIELRIYDSGLLNNINRLFKVFSSRLIKQEIHLSQESCWRLIIQPIQKEI